MKILALINVDYNFSAILTKVCDSSDRELFFIDQASEIKLYSDHNDALILLDVDEWGNELETVINKELKKLDTWLIVNRLSLNIKKTKFIVFHPYNKPVKEKITLKIHKIAIIPKPINDLGPKI